MFYHFCFHFGKNYNAILARAALSLSPARWSQDWPKTTVSSLNASIAHTKPDVWLSLVLNRSMEASEISVLAKEVVHHVWPTQKVINDLNFLSTEVRLDPGWNHCFSKRNRSWIMCCPLFYGPSVHCSSCLMWLIFWMCFKNSSRDGCCKPAWAVKSGVLHGSCHKLVNKRWILKCSRPSWPVCFWTGMSVR